MRPTTMYLKFTLEQINTQLNCLIKLIKMKQVPPKLQYSKQQSINLSYHNRRGVQEKPENDKWRKIKTSNT